MSPIDSLWFERAQPASEVASIRQILADLLIERGLVSSELREARGASVPWRPAAAVTTAA
jgi:hypothetical protein